MHRQIVYPGSIPQDTDLLWTNRYAMVGLGARAQAVLGNGPLLDGLACTPTTPASMSVQVGPGSIHSLQNLESTAYGSLAADTTDQTVKQGLVFGNTTFACAAPSGSGQSVVYLVQAQYQDVDSGSTVLPYFNAANPSVPYSGPTNSGVAQNTVRQGKCILGLKVGVAAATGSQVAPSPDAGYVGVWAITVANGATTITSGNIAIASGSPFISYKLTDRLAKQNNLSELTSPATARSNLGLGSAALLAATSLIQTVKTQTFGASGTYTPSAGMLFCEIEVVGGGGAGGSTAGGSGAAAASGGGAGGYARGVFSAAAIGASQSVTVGAGGSPGAAGVVGGGAGGTTSVGTLISAAGGQGGAGCANSTTNQFTSGGPGGQGGAGTGGQVQITGGSGGTGISFGGVPAALVGAGASNLFGSGGRAFPIGSSNAGGNNGAGPGGAGSGAASTTTSQQGGSGSGGVVYITEYCNQ